MTRYTVHIEGFTFLDHEPLPPLEVFGWYNRLESAEEVKTRLEEVFEHIPAAIRPFVFIKQEVVAPVAPLVILG